MTRRNSFAFIVSVVSLLACMYLTPVSACELNGAETCERPVAGYAEQSANGMIVVGALATPDTSSEGINAVAPLPDASLCGVASLPCKTVGI